MWHKLIDADNDWGADYQQFVMGLEQVSGRPEWHKADANGVFLNLNGKYTIQDGIYDGSSWGDPAARKSFKVGPKFHVWSMSTLVVEGTKALLYIDGVKTDSLTITSYDLSFKKAFGSLYGSIDEFRVYDIPVGQDVITALYNETKTPLSITTITEKEAVTIYPNPAFNTLTINTTEPINSVQIINVAGTTMQTSVPSVTNTIDISTLENGVYVLQVQTENTTLNKQFIKE